MRRVYPTQVVRFVEQYFPQAAQAIKPTIVTHIELPWRQKGFVRALVELTEDIPDHLITLQADSYGELVSSVAALHNELEGWKHPEVHAIQWLDGIGNPLNIIWRELSKCHDEGPVAKDVGELTFILDDQLRDVLETDLGSVETALQHGEWKAATVLAGSVVEALLLWATSQRGSTAFEECFRKSFPSEKRIDPKHPQEWHLHHLIDVAKSLKIVGDRTAEAATLAKDFRNLIHPGRTERLNMRANRATAHSAVAAIHHVLGDLSTSDHAASKADAAQS